MCTRGLCLLPDKLTVLLGLKDKRWRVLTMLLSGARAHSSMHASRQLCFLHECMPLCRRASACLIQLQQQEI